MTYEEALAVLQARQETRIALGLDRVRVHLARLGNPQDKPLVFHVAGTNGKGSTCAMLACVLREAGYRTGLYCSPHLFEPRERIQIDGRWITRGDFARLLARALEADADSTLTYFELLTSVAFQYFADKGVEVAVLETGLGGRLDATNVVDAPLAAVITSIDFDHMQFLGKTLAEIAGEKAGIFKAGCPAITPSLAPAALRVAKARAAAVGAPLTVVGRPLPVRRVDWARGRQILVEGRRELALSLLGARQGFNAALVKAALAAASARVEVSAQAWARGLAKTRWPGRFELRRAGRGRLAILDGAHNPEAARNLAATWGASPWARRPARWILGVMKDKDAAGILKPLRRHLQDVVTVRPPSPRAMDAAELAALVRRAAPRARVTIESDLEKALAAWRRGPAPSTAVVGGSFYLVGQAEKLLGGVPRG